MENLPPSAPNNRNPVLYGCLWAAGVVTVVLALFSVLVYLHYVWNNRQVPLSWQCQGNLYSIALAKRHYAAVTGKPDGTVVSWTDLLLGDRNPHLQEPLMCPAGGKYTLGPLGKKPTCSIGMADGMGIPPHHVEPKFADKCLRNLATIMQAKELLSVRFPNRADTTVSWDDLLTTTPPLLADKPQCPEGGDYNLGHLADFPACSYGTGTGRFPPHVLSCSNIEFYGSAK